MENSLHLIAVLPVLASQLRSFHAVATHGSFTRAAKVLHISQPTISEQVKELEERYGTVLFIRRYRKLELTEIGKKIFEKTQRLNNAQHEIEQILKSAQGLSSGELRIAADSPYIVSPIMADFQLLYPNIQLSVKYGNSKQLTKWLKSKECEVAFLPNVIPNDNKLYSIRLEPQKLVTFVNKHHHWASRQSVKLEEVVKERLILREKGSRTRSIFEDAAAKANIEIKNYMEIEGREGVREAVASGLGIGIVAELELMIDSRLKTLAVSNARLIHEDYVVCLQSSKSTSLVEAFFEIVKSKRK